MKFNKEIIKTPLFQISSINSVSVMVRVGCGLIAAKMLAAFVGPGGVALLGNLRNTLGAVDTFSTLGVQNGIIKYVAENEKDEVKLHRVLSTVFICLFILILVMSALMYLFSDLLSNNVFGSGNAYGWVFKVMAFTLPWHAGNIIFMAVINGLGKFREVIAVNIAGNITGLAISALLIWQLSIPGAMLGLIISPALLFLFSFYLVQRHFSGFGFLKRKNFDFTVIKRLLSYSLMSLVTAILGQIIYLYIRNAVKERSGIETAGFWESMNRISFFYLMFINTLLTVYFLPKLSTAKSDSETRSVFYSYYKLIVPLFITGCIMIYFLREIIIRILLTKEFLPMENLFIWQLLGDILKVCSLILGYQFFAKKMTRAFIITEIMSFGVLYVSSYYFIGLYGSVGAVMAHAFTYGIYLVVLATYFRRQLF